MNEPETPQGSLLQRIVDLLLSRDTLRGLPRETLIQVVQDWIFSLSPRPETLPANEVLDHLAARALARARLTDEERAVRTRLAAQLGSSLDDLETIVQQHFQGATRDIASRHSEAVRLSRTRSVIESVLHGLGGHGATLEQVLMGAGRAVSTPVLEVFGQAVSQELEQRLRQATQRTLSSAEVDDLLHRLRHHRTVPTAESAAIGQVAQAASQAVQQAAVNVQKILAIALEANHAADRDNNPHYYP